MSRTAALTYTRIEQGSANVYADLEIGDAEEMLVKAQLATKSSLQDCGAGVGGICLTNASSRNGGHAVIAPSIGRGRNRETLTNAPATSVILDLVCANQ